MLLIEKYLLIRALRTPPLLYVALKCPKLPLLVRPHFLFEQPLEKCLRLEFWTVSKHFYDL
jgi:hypothetical protein